MCLSPHEMTVAQIEEAVAFYRKVVERQPDNHWAQGKLENFEKLLKERAEQGRMADGDASAYVAPQLP